ncbi:ketopantoate reductase family protein [Pseudidiomarina sediminum]|uniref:ketopantoate reductase family protein n=1 Tax=Pseudidiomarina sediminum TaxID=431675 RepID=UPI001C947248|nr:ketopantoate reductase family protein [Pseudidiomarina sediminum]MBY6063386.1 ketopantoate reductase family protein [Pseudidiomarina sediminum]
MTTQPSWLVIGQGALGSLMAVHLAKIGQRVTVKLRSAHPEPLTIMHDNQPWSFPCSATLTQPSTIFAAVKAYHVRPLLDELQQAPAFAASTLILSYNGMLEDEASLLRPSDCHWVTTHGAYHDGLEVIHGGHGESWLGGCDQPPAAFETLAQALPPLHWHAEIHQRRWQKLAVNCLINPFTVLHQCRNGEVLERLDHAVWHAVATEIAALAATQGLQLQADELLANAQRVMQQTAQNRSSMLQDFRLGRRLEIDYLNGFVAQASATAGLDAPANDWVWRRVNALSQDRDLQ